MSIKLTFSITILQAVALLGQSDDKRAAFDAASVRPSVVASALGFRARASGGPGTPDPARFVGENLNLVMLVSKAYGVQHWQLSTPNWLGTTMFDITATIPEGATKHEFELMLQNLLADRFNLKVHWEEREMPVHELVIAKNGHKMRQSAEAPLDPSAGAAPLPAQVGGLPKRDIEGYPELAPDRPGMAMMGGRARMQAIQETMTHFASTLSGLVRGPVVDETHLDGKYDFGLYWGTQDSPRIPPAPSNAAPGEQREPAGIDSNFGSGPTIVEALRTQLGLNLEKKKGKVPVLVVDHIDRSPSPN